MATETTRETDTTPAGTETADDGRTDTGSTTTATTGTTSATTGSTTDSTDATESATEPTATDGSAADTTADPAAAGNGTTEAPEKAEQGAAGRDASTDQAGGGAAAARTSNGTLAGSGAVVGAGLGLASLTGTSLTDMLRDRQQLIGQIEAATGMPGDQIQSFYGAPWHTAAAVNGVIALIAVVVGAVLMLGAVRKPGAPAWSRPVALGGLVLGVLGLLVSGGMYLDLFAAQPTLPAMPAFPGMPG